jgi:hypothetical protein
VDVSEQTPIDARDAELEALRALVARLEDELAAQAADANAAVAAAQQRAYWLDRWHVDLNALMERRGASQLRGLLRTARVVVRQIRAVQRRLTG